MGDVAESVWGINLTDEASEHRGPLIRRQPKTQPIGEVARRPERRDDEQGCGPRRMDPHPHQRRAGESQQRHSIRIGERVRCRRKDVGLEETGGVFTQLMRDLRETPDIERGVGLIGNVRRPQASQWPRHGDGNCEQRERRGSRQAEPVRCSTTKTSGRSA